MSLAGHVEESGNRIEAVAKELGYTTDEETHTGSTRSFTLHENDTEFVVRLKETGAKIDIFHGARDQNGNRIHNTWRITSERKLEEVIWKIRTGTTGEQAVAA